MNYIKELLQKWSIECIIFDLDGTLIDTLDKHIEAFQILFDNTDYDITYEQISANMGRTPKDTLLSLIPSLENDKDKLNELANKKESILTTLLTEVPKLAGSDEILHSLKLEKYLICLASSTPKFNVSKMLEIAKINQYFDVIITGEDITIGKPNPEVFLKAANNAGISNEKCLVIGDSPHDIQAAKNANMKVIAVSTGKHSHEEVANEKPDLMIASLLDLLKVT